jgi:hypothetical protein
MQLPCVHVTLDTMDLIVTRPVLQAPSTLATCMGTVMMAGKGMATAHATEALIKAIGRVRFVMRVCQGSTAGTARAYAPLAATEGNVWMVLMGMDIVNVTRVLGA